MLRRSLLLLFLSGCAVSGAGASTMERVRVAPDGKGFQLADSGRRFTPWGFNYDHDEKGRLLEDYWDAEWGKVEEDFREMRELGATVVRIHLQVNRFMKSPERLNERALVQMKRLLALAEETRLYLDLTGLGCYRKADTPAWYEQAQEKERWALQARFWEAIAATCATSPAVLCYNLMNEPVSPAGPGKVWHGGEPLGGYYYVESLTLDPGTRSRQELTRQWITTLTPAIRRWDATRLITCGMFFIFEVPNGLTLGPDPKALAENLDYFSVHMYPKDSTVDTHLKLLATLQVGKPILIEEMFPLSCSMESFRRFVAGSRASASGWIGFYWGKTLKECRASKDLTDAFVAQWLEYFLAEGPAFKGETR
jgi:hypothetical protein